MLLKSWYQIDMSLYSDVRSKIGGQKWQPHILCKTIHVIFRFPADAMVSLAITRTCTEDDTRSYANIIPGTYKTQELPCGIRVAGNP